MELTNNNYLSDGRLYASPSTNNVNDTSYMFDGENITRDESGRNES